MMKKQSKVLATALVVLFSMQFVFSLVQGTAAIDTSQAGALDVLVFTPNPKGAFEIRLRLSETNKNASREIRIDYAVPANYTSYAGNLSSYGTIVVNSFLPDNATFINSLIAAVNNSGVGLFFWGGYYPVFDDPVSNAIKDILPVNFNEPFTIEEETYIDQGWVGQIELKVNDEYPYKKGYNNVTLIQRNVVWESSPLVRERIFVRDAKADANVLVYRPQQNRKPEDYNFTKGEPLVAYREQGNGRVLWVSMGTGVINATFSQYTTSGFGPYWNRTKIEGSAEEHNKEWNKPFYLWPYFNFFLYQSTMFLAGKTGDQIDTYAQWQHSPIPHETEAILWMLFVLGLWIFNFVLFFTLGRKKRKEGDIKPVTTEEAKEPEDGPTAEEEKKETPPEKEEPVKELPMPKHEEPSGGSAGEEDDRGESLLRKSGDKIISEDDSDES